MEAECWMKISETSMGLMTPNSVLPTFHRIPTPSKFPFHKFYSAFSNEGLYTREFKAFRICSMDLSFGSSLTQPFKDSHSVYCLVMWEYVPDSIHKRLYLLKSIPKKYAVNQEVNLSTSIPLYCQSTIHNAACN